MKKTLLAILAGISIFAFSSQTSFAADSDNDNYRGRGGYGCYQDDDEYHHGDYQMRRKAPCFSYGDVRR